MYASTSLALAALVSLAQAHGVVLAAQGDAGSPPSVGFGVNLALARNCTSISPCQQDTTIIRDAEIKANVVNECGRTELSGNIDVGENTENALAAGAVTKVKGGSKITVTIHQVNADGAGPYSCDIDETSNSGVISRNLTVTNNIPGVNGFSQAKTQDFNITVELPQDLACTGASTGNVCTVRCRNNAVAGPFGGCFAIQQTDIKGTSNTPGNIATAQSLKDVLDQVQIDQKDLEVAVQANQNAGTDDAVKNLANVEKLLGITVTSKAAAVQTLAVDLNGGASPVTTAVAAPTNAAGNGKNNGNKGGNGNNNAGNGNNAGGNRNGNNAGNNAGNKNGNAQAKDFDESS